MAKKAPKYQIQIKNDSKEQIEAVRQLLIDWYVGLAMTHITQLSYEELDQLTEAIESKYE